MTESETVEQVMVRLLQHRRALPGDPELVALTAKYFTGNARLSPVEQLEIYRQQFWLRHTGALLEDYPGVSGIIGQRAWERLAEEYLAAHPPATFSLRDLGANVPAFIALNGQWLEHHTLVSDMARLEWSYVEVFDAADAGSALTPEKLAHVPEAAWDRARILLSPALRLLRVTYPVVELRRQIVRSADESVRIPESEPSRLVVHRQSNLAIGVERLEETPFALLEALAGGASLPEACQTACDRGRESPDVVSGHVGGWFASWVQRSWIVDVKP